MDKKIRDAMVGATRASDEERVTFGEVVIRLMRAGVERYHTDLLRGEKTYYLPDGESEVVVGEPVGIAPAREFSSAGVDAALRDIQAGKIQYRAFCTRIAEAGCVGYHVSLAGQRALYYGRTCDCHVEWFPGAKREKAA
jgi:uncharacterized protein YbcV (DUF1398 family)